MPALPTGDDLKRLPLRGLIAYSARSALRVQPLYWVDEEHPEAEECLAAVDAAIRLALDFAAGQEINADEAAAVEDAVVRAVVVACDEKWSDRRAAFTSNAAYAAINAVTIAIASETAGSRSTEAVRSVMASVTAVDAAVAADPAIRVAVIADFKRLSRMSLGSFPNFGKAVDPNGQGVLGPVNLSRRNVEPTSRRNEEQNDEQGQPLQELQSPPETFGVDLADAESNLTAERQELDRQRKQIAARATEVEAERERLQEQRSQLALQWESLEQAQSEFREHQSVFEEERRRFEADNEAAQSERNMLEEALTNLERRENEMKAGCGETDAPQSRLDDNSATQRMEQEWIEQAAADAYQAECGDDRPALQSPAKS